MLNNKEFLKEEKDCASLLGMSLQEYREYVKNTKVPTTKKKEKVKKYDNSILKFFGLSTNDLKLRKEL